jgi:hypothetical protein
MVLPGSVLTPVMLLVVTLLPLLEACETFDFWEVILFFVNPLFFEDTLC